MDDKIIKDFNRRKQEKELEEFAKELTKHLETNKFTLEDVFIEDGNIIEGYFDSIEEGNLSPEEEEILKFYIDGPPENESAIQRRYRLNIMKEYEEAEKRLLSKTYEDYDASPELLALLKEMEMEALAKEKK